MRNLNSSCLARKAPLRTYICSLKLFDYLTYSSTVGLANVMGVTYTIYKPQPYIHNYPLMYGFAGLLYAALASPSIEVSEIDYSWLDEIERSIYAYPARPRRIVLKRTLLNIRGEGAVGLSQPRPKSMYPWHVVHLYFAPGSEFETVLLVKSSDVKVPPVIRVGVKRQGVFRVKCAEAEVRRFVSGFTDPVNLGDLLRYNIIPHSYTVLLNTKTTRKGVPHSNMIVRAYFDGNVVAVLETRDGQRFRVPMLG